MGVSKTDFGVTRDGRKASLYTIINKNGMEAVVSDFGAILVKLIVPNKDGEKADVVLGFDHLEQYEENPNFLVLRWEEVRIALAELLFRLMV